MNPAAVHTVVQLPPIRQSTGLRSKLLVGQGVGTMKSGASWVNRSRVASAISAKITSGPVTVLRDGN